MIQNILKKTLDNKALTKFGVETTSFLHKYTKKQTQTQRLTRFRMSFWKQLPPKPIDACRNFGPIRESIPIARDTSLTSAPVRSHSCEIALMLLTLCARKAFATSLESSEDQRLVVRICAFGTQLAYTSTSA